MILILLQRFYAWIAPYLAAILGVLFALTLMWALWERIEIYGIHIELPWFGRVALISGYKADASNAVKNYQIAHANSVKLQAALDDQTKHYNDIKAQRDARDKEIQAELAPQIRALQDTLAGKTPQIARLRAMVGNAATGKDEVARAHVIVDNAYPAPAGRAP